MKTGNHLVIDADIPVYQIGFSCESAVDWGDDFWSLSGDMNEARELFTIWVNNVREATGMDNVLMALTSGANWRAKLCPTYKVNRKESRKPVLFNPLRDFIRHNWMTTEIDTLEADDILGLYSSFPTNVLVSADKDLLTVPGRHFNPMKPEDGIIVVTPEMAYRYHMTQTLTGDSTDNYKGCPGVGPKGAEKLMDGLELEEIWPAVVERYGKAGLTEDDAILQARLAYIMRPGDYDYETGEVKLWNPR